MHTFSPLKNNPAREMALIPFLDKRLYVCARLKKFYYTRTIGSGLTRCCSHMTILHMKERNKRHARFQQELLRTQLEIQEQTFRTLSQEIHDNIGQMLSLAKLNLNTIDLQKEAQAGAKINSAKALVSKAIQDLRTLSKSLNPETIIASGLLRAIEAELHLVQKTGALQTAFQVTGTPVRLAVQKELILFRLVQQAVYNISKETQASGIQVRAVYEYGHLKLLIAGNEQAVASRTKAAFSSSRHTMQSRCKLIGADCQIESDTSCGTTIYITLPIAN